MKQTGLLILFYFLLPLSLHAQVDFQDLNGDGEIRIAAIGDSITSGVGDGVPAGITVVDAPRIPGVIGYPGRMAEIIGRPVSNLGLAGDQMVDRLPARFSGAVQSVGADYVLVLAGSNDAGFRTSVSAFKASLQKIINIAGVIGTEPILVTLPPTCCDRSGREPFLQSYSQEVRQLAGVNELTFADLELAFATECPIASECRLLNRPEGLHPNSEGYDFIGRVLSEILLGVSLPTLPSPEEVEEEED